MEKATVAEDTALRDQLHVEIEKKTRGCAHAAFQCSLPRLEGLNFCLRHILQDPAAPYVQCAFNFPISGHRCPLAAPRHDRQKNKHFSNFCFEHSRLSQLTKTHSLTGKMKHPDSVEGHLGNLTHYVRLKKDGAEEEDVDIESLEPMNLDPLTEIDAGKVNERSRKNLDFASDSETEDDEPVGSQTWPFGEQYNSDADSIDSELEDPLKHAGIYTTEEACSIAKNKLKRLRYLYLEQFHRLGYILRERRRRYLLALRKEKEVYCSIYNQARETDEERQQYAQLKALNKYHRSHGIEAVVRRKYNDKRMKAFGGQPSSKSHYNRCTFADGGVKCLERVIPCSKFCRRHITEDRKQVLFRACGIEKSGVVCQEPVPMIFDDATCGLHIEVPPERTYVIRKYESEPEDDDDDENNSTKGTDITIKEEPLDEGLDLD